MKQGDKAPNFTIDSMNGAGKMTVAPGKVTIVDFWATWCEPCKKSFPKLQELYVKYKASGLEIVAVSVDDEKNGIADFAKTQAARSSRSAGTTARRSPTSGSRRTCPRRTSSVRTAS